MDGSNGRNVNVTVNGIDDKDNTVGGPVMQLPLEAVEEFKISTQRFSAANGRSEGAADHGDHQVAAPTNCTVRCISWIAIKR